MDQKLKAIELIDYYFDFLFIRDSCFWIITMNYLVYFPAAAPSGAACPTCDESLNCVWGRVCPDSQTCMIRSYPNYKFSVHCSIVSGSQTTTLSYSRSSLSDPLIIQSDVIWQHYYKHCSIELSVVFGYIKDIPITNIYTLWKWMLLDWNLRCFVSISVIELRSQHWNDYLEWKIFPI